MKNRLHKINMNEAQIRAIVHALKSTPDTQLLAKAYATPLHELSDFDADTITLLAGMFDDLVNQSDSDYDAKMINGFTL